MHDIVTLRLRNATRIVLSPSKTCVTRQQIAHVACEHIVLFVLAGAEDRPLLTYVRHTGDESLPERVMQRMLLIPDDGLAITGECNSELLLGRIYAIRFGEAGPTYVQSMYACMPRAALRSPLAPWNDCV